MPYDNTYFDGSFRFINKSAQTTVQTYTPPSNVINVGLGDYIQTDIIKISYKIIDINHNVIGQFMIKGTVGWVINGSQIQLSSSDQIIYYLLFNSQTEASTADLRLWKIMEGHSVINPGDENLP